jgi:hypothetical protein
MSKVVFLVEQGKVDHLKSDYQGVHQVDLIKSFFDDYLISDNLSVISEFAEAYVFGNVLWNSILESLGISRDKDSPEYKSDIVVGSSKIIFLNHYVLCYHSGQRDSNAFKENRSKFQKSTLANKEDKSDLNPIIVEPDRFEEVYDNLMSSEPDIGFDIETNAMTNWHREMHINGFSLVNESHAYYVNTMDTQLSPDNRKRFIKLLASRKPWTYNCKFEISAIHSKYGVKVEMNDAYALCKIDGSVRSLKENATKYLNATKWNSEVEIIIGIYEKLFEFIGKTGDQGFIDILKTGEVDYATFCTLVEGLKYRGKSYLRKHGAAASQISGEYFKTAVSKYPFHWSTPPKEILGNYCILDSYYTVGLKRHLYPRYERVYPYFIKQSWVAAQFESNGVAWDDAMAEELDVRYRIQQAKSLNSLIQLIDCSPEKKAKAASIDVEDIWAVDKLKEIFNPGSTTAAGQAPFWRFFKNDTTIKQAINLYLELNMTSSGVFDDVSKCFDDNDGYKTVLNISNLDIEDWGKKRKIKAVLGELSNIDETKFSGFAADIIDFHFSAFNKYSNIQIDDETTWTPQFASLIHLKTYKKLGKNRSTYINGKTGRDQVYLCKRGAGINPPERITHYSKVPKDYKIKPDEIFILNTSFSENVADTKRWSAGWHCLHANTLIQFTDGSVARIEDIYKDKSLLGEVYSVNEGTTDLIKDTISDVVLSYYAHDMIELTLANGKTIECTPDHRFLMTNGEYIQAKDIDENTELFEF